MNIDITQHFQQRMYVEAVRLEMIAELNRGRATGEHPAAEVPSAAELSGMMKVGISRGLKAFEIAIDNGALQIVPKQPKKAASK